MADDIHALAAEDDESGTWHATAPPSSPAEEAELARRHHTVDTGPATEIPAQVARYLLDGERSVIITREHEAALWIPSGCTVAAATAAVALNGWLATRHANTPAHVYPLYVLALAALAWWGWRRAVWAHTWFVVTAKRVMALTGWPRVDVEQLPIPKLRDFSMEQSLIGQWLGYGDFRFMSIGTDHELSSMRFVPRATDVHREISRLITPGEQPGGPRL